MEVLNEMNFDEWQETADKSDYATFFHTPSWYKVFLQTTKGSAIATKKFIWDDGRVAIFPLLQTISMKKLVRTYQSSPAGCYGGWISKDELLPQQITEMTKWIIRSCKNMVWRLNPFAEGLNQITRLCPMRKDSTQVLYLDRFQNEDSLLKNYGYSVRKQIAKGQKAGFKVTTASSWEDWQKYFEIYKTALARWGDKATSSYSIEFFRTVFDLQSPSVQLWLVLSGEQIVGGNLNFYQGRHCVEWHATFNEDFFKFGVRNFFVHNLIMDALNRGCKFYDFNPSGGHEGVKSFKKSFGAEELPSPVVNIQSFGLRFLRFVKRSQKKVVKQISRTKP
jgi:lipid II:glycine glycyltransferase (peptidoglycan interpeptide bridge formation enzyme)